MKQACLLGAALLLVLTVPSTLSALNVPEGPPSSVRTITGQVTDAETNEALIGVNILVKGSTSGGITDFDGNYSITAETGDVLIFSYLSYISAEYKISNQGVLNVKLEPDAQQLDEVVVVGYGTTKRSDVTGSLSSITSEELREVPVTGLDQAILGRAAGVQVTQNSGAPGGGVSIRVRGIGSTLTAEPLYVIDGIPVVNDNSVSRSQYDGVEGNVQASNTLNTINPNDIESIEILKDASATAIYGARGANGVVLITTKRGKAGRSKVSLESYVGTQKLDRQVDVLNLREYAAYYNSNNFNAIEEFQDLDLLGEGTNWQEEIFRRAFNYNTQLTLSGGGERTQFAVSGGFNRNEGIVIGSAFERFSGKINLDHQINDRVRLGNSLLVARTKEDITLQDNSRGVVYTALLFVPAAPVRNADGSFAAPQDEIELNFINPVSRALETSDINRKTRLLANFYFEADLLPFLTYRTEFGTDLLFAGQQTFQPAYERGQISQRSSLQVSKNENRFWINKHLLTLKKTFADKHNINLLAGFEAQEGGYEFLFASRNDLPNNTNLAINLGDAGQQNNGGGSGDFALVSYFGRANYSFSDRYQLTATVRADGSSRFGANNRYGVFPSAAFAWRLSNESFLANWEKLDNLKFRVGYGAVGNQEIGFYSFTSNVGAVTAVQGDQIITAFAPSNIPNPDVKWESSFQTNFGIDLGLFNNRIEIIADYYSRRADGNLLPALLPATTGGLSAPIVNVGEIVNNGFELTLNTQNTTGKFDWSTSFNFSRSTNEVTNLGSNGSLVATVEGLPVTRTEVGQPIGQFYGFVVDGIFQEPNDVTEAPFQSIDTRAGDIKFKDLNNDGIINAEDQTFIGNPLPDFTANISNRISYKGFDLSFLFQGVFGNDILNMVRRRTESFEGFGNQSTTILDRYTPANPSNTIPRAIAADPNANTRISTRFIEDGSFIRLKNLSLGYRLPQNVIKRLNMENLRFYVSGQNLITFTDYTGYDPEVGSFNQNPLINNVDNGRYPISRAITFGLNANF
ncbi:SusC/RagA family TonB-linked outer membrane protein [Neolewinella agarilytica]|uniref:TonB-linked outer membrane protein, SusC/RagA family n=1 Tax=Neolewinella agarilytica TaxID=478744 RepID=A0A1H9HUN9_9BACT|nr:TonB-dependent receptor [Neolewinella agarilytica]SEQ66031.1 TonB-linked outer membrane protein, SusC/RagA family [Neolewinella agarilytica]